MVFRQVREVLGKGCCLNSDDWKHMKLPSEEMEGSDNMGSLGGWGSRLFQPPASILTCTEKDNIHYKISQCQFE